MISITLNGEPKQIADRSSLKELLADLNLPSEGVAVAINGEVVSRSAHDTVILRDHDVVEIIHAVGGGTVNLSVGIFLDSLGSA